MIFFKKNNNLCLLFYHFFWHYNSCYTDYFAPSFLMVQWHVLQVCYCKQKKIILSIYPHFQEQSTEK